MTLEEMNLACERLEAAQACRNLVGKLSYLDSAFRMKDLLALWDNSDEAELRLPDETHQGFEAVKAALEARGDRDDAGMDVKMRGTLVIHNMNSDALEISHDAKTAHGTWFSPGIETDLFDPADPARLRTSIILPIWRHRQLCVAGVRAGLCAPGGRLEDPEAGRCAPSSILPSTPLEPGKGHHVDAGCRGRGNVILRAVECCVPPPF